ncbi:hypothetical protein [Janthinobacterium agaricidamnosum]|uniref:Putative membrane protein n=1 Tax=Janthinobacterium agaricidamnosum NBRC 102515 = DSM 9628 TaxID=1349767 RepID=W0V798_9BURK|nr:hypothetical protein [Janthinobacterium agaricidamnosum]CDG83233.1 putative membrane protein [Janthinobacterium agaricidamnosum NBRC 102515 = DSM 9628]
MKSPLLSLWGWPVVLGLLTCIGLISALLGDDWWDALSALTLGVPVAIGAWYSLKGRSR